MPPFQKRLTLVSHGLRVSTVLFPSGRSQQKVIKEHLSETEQKAIAILDSI